MLDYIFNFIYNHRPLGCTDVRADGETDRTRRRPCCQRASEAKKPLPAHKTKQSNSHQHYSSFFSVMMTDSESQFFYCISTSHSKPKVPTSTSELPLPAPKNNKSLSYNCLGVANTNKMRGYSNLKRSQKHMND